MQPTERLLDGVCRCGNWRRHDLADDAEREVRDDFFGRSSFSINVTTVFPAGQTHDVTFPNVAHPYVAAPAVLQGNQAPPAIEAGPVEYVKLATADPGVLDPNTRNNGDPALASVIVTVGIRRPFQVESPLVDPVVLRVASPSGSQNQAFDCDTGINFQNEIAGGCQTTYRENYGDWNGDGLGVAGHPLHQLPERHRPAAADVLAEPRAGLRPCRDRRQDRPVQAGPHRAAQEPVVRAQQLARDPDDFHDFFRTYDFANDPRYVTLIVTDYGAFPSREAPGRAGEVLRRLLHHRVGTRTETTPSAPTTSRIPGTRRATARASTTATSGGTSSTLSSSRRPGRPTTSSATSTRWAHASPSSSSSPFGGARVRDRRGGAPSAVRGLETILVADEPAGERLLIGTSGCPSCSDAAKSTARDDRRTSFSE